MSNSIYSIPMQSRNTRHKICPICGKTFIVNDSTVYAYKKNVKTGRRSSVVVYVHTWSCLLRLEEKVKAKDISFLAGNEDENGKTEITHTEHKV